MTALFWVLVLISSLLVLAKASEWLSDSAEKIGLVLKIPSFIIGVTIVSIGTSLPELVSSILAVEAGSSEIVIASVVGSNITNIFLVLGLAAIIAGRLEISYDLIHVDLPLFVGAIFYLGLALIDGDFNLFEGIVGILGSILYIVYTVNTRKSKKDGSVLDHLKLKHKNSKLNLILILKILISAVLIFVSATYTVDSAVELAESLEVAPEIVAVLVIAFGTSLPELFVSVAAARKGHYEMVIGSILGSCIFNSFAIVGIASLFGTITVPVALMSVSLPMMIAAAILYFFITQEKQITGWEGAMLLLFYAVFIEEVVRSAV
ncbi:calcium/sodium antiporter [Candidatus Dojkabacteria bacterium]|nr:calcium/sodium antiporter [Candidatus Dojkabacteria bacterium]